MSFTVTAVLSVHLDERSETPSGNMGSDILHRLDLRNIIMHRLDLRNIIMHDDRQQIACYDLK